jgi:hypothetical protein
MPMCNENQIGKNDWGEKTPNKTECRTIILYLPHFIATALGGGALPYRRCCCCYCCYYAVAD